MRINQLTPGTNINHIDSIGVYPAPLVTRTVRLTKVWVKEDQSSFELHGVYTDDGSEFLIGDYDATKEVSSFPYLTE